MMNRLIVQLDELKKYNKITTPGARGVEVAHRRWGKDDVGLHFTACAAHMRAGNYWHMLPKYEQCRKAIWDAINPKTGKKRIDEAFPPELRKKTNQQEMKIELYPPREIKHRRNGVFEKNGEIIEDERTGSIWQLVGSDNYNSIVGSPPIGIVQSEYALSNPVSWAYLSPIVEENHGWAMFISTSRGRNHFKTIYDYAKRAPDWFGDIQRASETTVFNTKQLERIKQEYMAQFGPDIGLALFLQEYECSFEGAVLGAYYSHQMAQARKEKRVGKVPWQPGVEVNTYWDLGLDDSMSIWMIQHVGRAHHIIDYEEGSGMGLEWYAKKLKERPYVYGNHYMPHDANTREMTTGEIAKSRKEVAEELGLRPIIVVERARNMDVIVNVHIPAVRNILPSCWFDEDKCHIGINALENYHAKYDETKKVLTRHPEHDHNSHGADAFRTLAVGYEPTRKMQTVEEILGKHLR